MRISRISIIALCLCLFNCKQESTKKNIEVELIYSKNAKIITCEGLNTVLLQEALLAFEQDITTFYTPNKSAPSRAYGMFTKAAISNRADYATLVSDHSKQIFEALKQEKELWTTTPNGSQLNYKHPIFACIGNQIKNSRVKQTYNALLQTNSMSLRTFNPVLLSQSFGMKSDPYFGLITALQLYYGQLYGVDFNTDNSEQTKLKSNQQEKPNIDSSHEGHNH